MFADYSKITKIPKKQENNLILDFEGIDFLNTFEITELFAYLISFSFTGEIYKIENNSNVVSYLHCMNFFKKLEQIKKLNPCPSNQSYPTSNNNKRSEKFLELQTYFGKEAIYSDADRLDTLLKNIGLGDDSISSVIMSLFEVVDNAFSHNLGEIWEWFGKRPLSILLAQNFQKKEKLCFSFCDFGAGFLQTLKGNYSELNSQKEAIFWALKPNTTGRPQNIGGNGLDFLLKTVLSGFKGNLCIRSGNILVSARDNQSSETPFTTGANVFFSISYKQ